MRDTNDLAAMVASERVGGDGRKGGDHAESRDQERASGDRDSTVTATLDAA